MITGALACSGTFFFFQAEDGIRDLTVTGVQTCALPIYSQPPTGGPARERVRPTGRLMAGREVGPVVMPTPPPRATGATAPLPPSPQARDGGVGIKIGRAHV